MDTTAAIEGPEAVQVGLLSNMTSTVDGPMGNSSHLEDEEFHELEPDFDMEAYIARRLGAQHLPLTTIVPISVVYAVIFVLGVLGNVSTILVILKNKYMHTPTNVYLANLAISDLLTHLVGKQFMVIFSRVTR